MNCCFWPWLRTHHNTLLVLFLLSAFDGSGEFMWQWIHLAERPICPELPPLAAALSAADC